MPSPCTEMIEVRFTADEHRLLEDLAAMRRMSISDVVREMMGFEREDEIRRTARPSLRVISA
jgi:uncharacterized protein (DUF1778 family)